MLSAKQMTEVTQPLSHNGMRYSKRLNCWIVDGYEEALAVLNNAAFEIPRLPLPENLLSAEEQIAIAPLWEQAGLTPLYAHGRRHLELRRSLREPFLPASVARWRRQIRDIAGALIEQRWPIKSIEIVENLAKPLLTQVMATVIGIPADMRYAFDEYAHAAMSVGKLGTPDWSRDVLDKALNAKNMLGKMAACLVEHPEESPDGSLIRSLGAHTNGKESLPIHELAANLRSLYTAGIHSTMHLVSSAAYLMFANDEVLTLMRKDEGIVSDVVRETLRFACPAVEVIVRRATRDVSIAPHSISRGEFVRTVVLHASRDPRKYDDPNTFHINRPHDGKTLAFGVGPHTCLGNHLATAIAEETCIALAETRHGASLALPHPRFVRRPAHPVVWGPEWVRLSLRPVDGGGHGASRNGESVNRH